MSGRSCKICMQPGATGTMALLQRELLALAGVDSADIDQGVLTVHYQFPATTLAAILRTLRQHEPEPALTPLQCGLLLIRAFMEENERDYIAYSCGWWRYLEDIYSRYFDSRSDSRVDIRKQTWRKYK